MTPDAARRGSRWICRRSSDFALREWADGFVLFDEANGQLQRLNPSAGRMMAIFLEKPDWTSCGLAQAIFGEAPVAADIELVENALANFQTLNLIERLPD